MPIEKADHPERGESVPPPPDFHQLLQELQENPTERIGPLLEQFRPYLLAIAMGEFPDRLQSKVGTSDLIQETMLRGLEGFADFRGASRAELAAWLRQILLNHMANVANAFATGKRNVSREVEIDSRVVDPLQASPSAETLSREEWDLLRGAVEKLSEVHRQVVLLRHRENLSFGDIGKLMDRSEEAARKLWCRAIDQLQRELTGHERPLRPK